MSNPELIDTDHHLLSALHSLPLVRQREFIHQVIREARLADNLSVLPAVLCAPEVRAEFEMLARASAIEITELVRLLDPRIYSTYPARSQRCTMLRMISTDFGRVADAEEVDVRVKARAAVSFEHRLRTDFALHVRRGRVTIGVGNVVHQISEQGLFQVEREGPVRIAMRAGSEITYCPHPLAAWLAMKGIAA